MSEEIKDAILCGVCFATLRVLLVNTAALKWVLCL